MKPTADQGDAAVILYESPEGEVQLDVHLEQDMVWLSLDEMVELFGRNKSVISRHLRSVFTSGELQREAVAAKAATAAANQKPGQVERFNLDAILSVGYRVNSKQAAQFRTWATRTLHDHLSRGYTVNEPRLREKGVGGLQQAVGLLARTPDPRALATDEGRAVFDVVERYTRAWRLLLEYDERRLAGAPARPRAPTAEFLPDAARTAINRLRDSLAARGETTVLFGREHGHQLGAILGAIDQTFGGEPLYPTVQVRAAHLLYFVIKDHPFADGNKRIGALLFLEYLHRNHMLVRADGTPLVAVNAMVTLALLVAESAATQKDLMIRLILNLLEDGGG